MRKLSSACFSVEGEQATNTIALIATNRFLNVFNIGEILKDIFCSTILKNLMLLYKELYEMNGIIDIGAELELEDNKLLLVR